MSKQCSTLSKQYSILLPKTATMPNEFMVKFRPFYKVECCFDIVAVLLTNPAVATKSNKPLLLLILLLFNNVSGIGNNIERKFVLSTKSMQILNMFNLFRVSMFQFVSIWFDLQHSTMLPRWTLDKA